MPTYTLFVGGIGPKASLAEIEAEFMTFGKCICSFKGNFGFVEFEDRKQAKDAMLHIHGMKFNGERLGVDWKKQKTAGPEGDAWAPERRRAGGTARPITSEYHRRSNRERDRDRSRDRGSYRSHRDRDSREGREAERRRGGSFRSRSRERDRDRYDREHRSRSWDRGGKDWERSRGRDRDSMGARRRNDREAGYRSRSRSRSRDRRRLESVQSRRTEYRGDYRTRERGKSPGRRERDERRDRRGERDGSGGSSGERSPAVDGRTGDVSQEGRGARERGSGSQRESGTDDVTRRSRKRKSGSGSGSGSGILNGDGRPSDQSSRGVHGHEGKNGGVEEAGVEGEGGDAEEGNDKGDEPRDDSEAALHTDLSEALHTGSENGDDHDEDDEPRLTAEETESMTLSELRKELKFRNLNFSGKRPALTKRLLAAMNP